MTDNLENRLADYPVGPEDRVMQSSANALAYLTCASLFIEGRTLEQSLADVMPAAAKIPRQVDWSNRSVTVTLGRWTATARDLGDGRGCAFV